jgi:DNA-binding response OmpR family regulator
MIAARMARPTIWATIVAVAGTADHEQSADEPGRFDLAPVLSYPQRDDPAASSSNDEAMDIQRRTVLVIEDEPAITEPLSEALSREGFVPAVAATIADGLRLARSQGPDLVLLDVMLPDGSGFEALRELRASGRTPVIMLTARGEEADRVAGLELGADDYVIKPFSARELVARVRAVLRRASAAAEPLGRDPVIVGAVRLDPSARTVTLDDRMLDLTRKEFDLLALLMSHAGAVVTRERLIDEVWDVNWFGSTKTLDVHVSGLRKKLGDDPSTPTYLHTVRGVGFRFAARVRDGAQ